MIEVAIDFLTKQLNNYFILKTNDDVVKIAPSRVVDETGRSMFGDALLCASVINIEEERIFKSQLPQSTFVNNQHVVLEPEIKLNLYILFGANNKEYPQALRYLSYILTYFQARSSFTTEEYPDLDPRIAKLSMELQSLSYEQLNQIWAYIGGKQLPSVIYKVRMVCLQDESQMKIEPPITSITANLHQ